MSRINISMLLLTGIVFTGAAIASNDYEQNNTTQVKQLLNTDTKEPFTSTPEEANRYAKQLTDLSESLGSNKEEILLNSSISSLNAKVAQKIIEIIKTIEQQGKILSDHIYKGITEHTSSPESIDHIIKELDKQKKSLEEILFPEPVNSLPAPFEKNEKGATFKVHE